MSAIVEHIRVLEQREYKVMRQYPSDAVSPSYAVYCRVLDANGHSMYGFWQQVSKEYVHFGNAVRQMDKITKGVV